MRNHQKNGVRVGWRRVEQIDNTTWNILEFAESDPALGDLEEQFLLRHNQMLAPCAGREMLLAPLADGCFREAPVAPKAQPEAASGWGSWKAQAPAPDVAPPTREEIEAHARDADQTLIEDVKARAWAAIKRGADRLAVIARLKAANVDTKDFE
jgi:hypothetical protein